MLTNATKAGEPQRYNPRMGESPTPLPSFGAPSPSSEESRPPLVPLAIGAGAVLVIVVLFIVFGRSGSNQSNASAAVDPYAANLAIASPTMSTADNFAGQQQTYIEGKITNNGSKNLNNVVLQILFRDSLGQVVQKETQRLQLITTREPYIDTAPLSPSSPLKPGQTREFRLTFEHVSSDWNTQLPEISVLRTSTS